MANIILHKVDHSFHNDCNEDDALRTLVCSSNSINIESLYPPLNSSLNRSLHLKHNNLFNFSLLIRNDMSVGVLQTLYSRAQDDYLQCSLSCRSNVAFPDYGEYKNCFPKSRI